MYFKINEAIELLKRLHGVYFLAVINGEDKALIMERFYPLAGHNATVSVWCNGRKVRQASVTEGSHC